MKKFLTLIAAVLFSAGAFADSYTLTFKTNGKADATNVIQATAAVADVVDQGTQYVTGFAIGAGGATNTSTTAAYLGKDGYGLKFGTSSRGANLVINLAALGQVKADSIVLNACAWWNTSTKNIDTPSVIVNDQAVAVAADTLLTDYTVKLNGSQLQNITFSNGAKGRWYLKSVTVYYSQSIAFDPAIAHSPRYAEGKTYEVLLGPDMVDENKTMDGETNAGISDLYQWITYTNPTGTLDDGKAQLPTSNRWTNINPAEENDTTGTWMQVTGLYNNAGSVKSPCLDFVSYKKYITFYVKDTKRFVAFAAGSASSNAANMEYIDVVAKSADGSSVVEGKSTPGKIYGKGTSSDFVGIDLDPTLAYEITIKDACDADYSRGKTTVMLTGIQLWGVDSLPGVGVRKATTDSYSYWETLLGPDMITSYTGINDKGQEQTYYRTNAQGVKYTNPTDIDTDGTNRVQVSNRWTNLDPTTFATNWIQVKGKNGSVQSPVITKRWGKYIEFNVTGTKVFRVFGAGSSSNKATDLNAMYLTVTPFNNNAGVFTANSTPGKIYGKGTSSDSVSVELNPLERYTIRIETADKQEGGKDQDIMITGINLQTEQGIAEQAQNLGTLNRTIAAAVAAGDSVVDLEAGQSYTLNGEAPVAKMTINGNGAKVVTDATGQITATKSVIVDNVKFDCANSTVAPVALSATPDPETYTYGKKYGEPIYYTQHEVDSINALGGDSVHVTDIKDYTEAYKYAGANQKVYEAELISIKNSEFTNLAAPLVDGNKQAYALLKLDIDNTNVFQAYKTGDPTINWYGGPNSIKDINIVNSTLANDSVNNNVYFLRYSNASNAAPRKVFGTGATASWVMKNNTFVNISSNQNFANNYLNDPSSDSLTWKGNIFANVYRLQKAGQRNKLLFEASDNIGVAGVHPIDATDKQKYLTEDSLVFNPNNAAHEYYVAAASQAAKLKYGDPDWLVEYQTAPLTLVVTQTQNKDFVAAINDFLTTSEAPEQITVSFQEAGEYPTSGELKTIAPVTFRADSIEAGAATIVAKHGMTLGAGFTFDGVNINADSLTTPVITLQTNEYKYDAANKYYKFGDIYLKNMKASGMKGDLIYGNKKANLIGTLSTENSEIYMAAAKTVYNFNSGGLTVNFIFKNSTLDAAQSYMYSTQSGVKATQWGIDMIYYTIENASIINPGKKFFQHRQNSQKWESYTLKNSLVLVNSGKPNFVSEINAGGRSSNPTWNIDGNAFQQLAADSTCTDVANQQDTGDKDEPVKNTVVGTMAFNSLVQPIDLGGTFTLPDSVEAPASLGDPRWTINFVHPVAGDVTYFLKEGDAFTSGQIVTVIDSTTMDSVATIQYGEAGGADFAAAKLDGNAPEGYIASTGGNGVNGNKAGGTFYTIVPKYDGVISAAVILNANKSFHLTVDGVQDSTFDGNIVESKFYGNFTFNVKAGSSYKFYCDGSKLGFYGFNYKYGPNVEPITEVSITETATGIDNVNVSEKKAVFDPNAPIYNLAGQRVGNDYKGVVIQNGRKYIKK